MYKKVLITGMALLGSLNFCFGANIQCWDEYRGIYDSNAVGLINSRTVSGSDSKLYSALKDKATVVYVGVVGGKAKTSDGITMTYTSYLTSYDYRKTYVNDDYIALKFCAVFNDSSSSTSTNATAAVNYIIKAK